MTAIDELLETVSPEVRKAIEDLCDEAGTWDADWSVLKAAGEMLADLSRKIDDIKKYIHAQPKMIENIMGDARTGIRLSDCPPELADKALTAIGWMERFS